MRKLLALMALCGVLVFSGSAWSYVVDGADVGGLDSLIASEELGNSSQLTQINWVNAELTNRLGYNPNYSATDMTKYNVGSASWRAVGGGIYALDFQSTDPAYFFLKTGLTPEGHDHFLYENKAELAWGVINLAEIGVSVENITKISHVGENGGSVPETVTLLLIGLGLVGLTGMKRIF